MPIIFRCENCGQKLSITRKKAGKTVTCPECVHRIAVPVLEEPGANVAVEPEDDLGQTEIVHSEAEPPISEEEVRETWQHKRNPWLEEDEQEDDDFSLGESGLEESGLDMTPMVDVTFLLLIFFMITASFSMQKSMQTTPPEPDEEGAAQSISMEDVEEESVVVTVDAENNIRVDDVPVSGIGELRDVLAAKISNEGKAEMLIEIHPNAKHGTVVAITDVGMDVDMQRIRRSTQSEDD